MGRTFFQMDSNAPVPFLGMDLLPKRKETSAAKEVSRFQDDAVTASASREAATDSEPPPNQGLSQKWLQLLGGGPKEKSLQLPVTTNAEFDALKSDLPVEDFR